MSNFLEHMNNKEKILKILFDGIINCTENIQEDFPEKNRKLERYILPVM